MSITKENLQTPVELVSHPLHGSDSEVWLGHLAQQGMSILEEAQVPTFLEQLREAMQPDFTDGQITTPEVSEGFGGVYLHFEWAFQDEVLQPPRFTERFSCNTFSVRVDLMNKRIEVSARGLHREIPESVWRENPDEVELAIIAAYQNPSRKFMDKPVARESYSLGQ